MRHIAEMLQLKNLLSQEQITHEKQKIDPLENILQNPDVLNVYAKYHEPILGVLDSLETELDKLFATKLDELFEIVLALDHELRRITGLPPKSKEQLFVMIVVPVFEDFMMKMTSKTLIENTVRLGEIPEELKHLLSSIPKRVSQLVMGRNLKKEEITGGDDRNND